MAAVCRRNVATSLNIFYCETKLFLKTGRNPFSSSSVCYLDQKWRQAKGLSANPNSYGQLTNLPDYKYLDGRPTLLGVGQNERMVKQRQYAETIIRMSNEIDFAIERHKQVEQKQEEYRRKILESKLKPKGSRLLLKS